MGGNCGTEVNPNTVNQCAVPVGETSKMPGFCTFISGGAYGTEFCSKMSTAGEWGNPQGTGFGCYFNNCNFYQEVSPGCCDGCCGTQGQGLSCQRLSFTGDPITCCFKDMFCTAPDPQSNPPQCYSDPGMQQACSDGNNGLPDYRALIGPDCQEILIPYCTGTLPTDNPNSTEWLDRWTITGTGSCSYAVNRNLFRGTEPCVAIGLTGTPGICGLPPPVPFDSEGYFWAQRLVSAAMTRYQDQGFQLGTLPGFPGYNPWQDYLYNNICCPFPGLCQSGLEQTCATKTAQRISLNPAVAQWCGCHLPVGEYEDYSAKFNIPPECTPMCNRAGTVPIVGINGEAVNCRQGVCLIDGVTINLINSQIGGSIDFDQICANCAGAQCSCVVSDTTIDISNSTIGGNLVPVFEGCGSFTCSQTNPGTTGPSTLNLACGLSGTFNPYTELQAEQAAAEKAGKKNAWLWTLIAIGLALILIFFIVLIVHPIMGTLSTVVTVSS